MGSGVGDPFGPRCNKGDIMGCGVLFPRDFEFRSDSEEEEESRQEEAAGSGPRGQDQDLLYSGVGEETDSGDEEDWCQPHQEGEKVKFSLIYLHNLCICFYCRGLRFYSLFYIPVPKLNKYFCELDMIIITIITRRLFQTHALNY
jgi:hypothetical protein